MLENEFFPTPNATIREMVSFANYKQKHGSSVLDPNGGSGAILDYLKQFNVSRFNNNHSVRDLYTLEINQDLKYTLQGKGYKVLGFDFLQYDEPTTFDWIFMNPPFSNGVDHVLKAYTHLKDNGTLVALLNAQTLKNPHTKSRQNLIHLLCRSLNEGREGWTIGYSENNLVGTLEQLEAQERVKWLGRCFVNAERPTTVEVVMIKITKLKKLPNINFEEIKFDLDAEIGNQQYNPSALASKDVVRDLVARYNASRKILIDRHETQAKLDFYLKGISDPVYGTFDRSGRWDKTQDCLRNDTDLNTQLAFLKSQFWNTVFVKTEIGNKATSNFKKKFEEFTIQQSAIAFTEENVKEVLYLFIANMRDMMKDCVIEVFDKATAYHEKNQLIDEGWKTNKSWKLNKRIILPYGVTFDGRGSSFFINDRQSDFLDDLDKIMDYLSGIKTNREGSWHGSSYCTISRFCNNHSSEGKHYSDSFENEHFNFRIFKKGTLHIDFKDLKVLEQINRIAADGKNWIGQGY